MVFAATYQFKGSFVQVSVLSREMVHPALHKVLTEDQRYIVLWQQWQDFRKDFETPEFTLSR
jgi:hypothetical protein